MPLHDTQKAASLLDYWKRSQHIQALKPADREAFVILVITPDLNRERDAFRRGLLDRLASRVRSAA